jgi:hypothetical protein
MKKCTKQRRNDTYKKQGKYSEKYLSHCHFFHHKLHMDWLGDEPVPPLSGAGD